MKNNKNTAYTPFFCEENIWQLLKSIPSNDFYKYNVLFLTNQEKTIALANQKAVPVNEFIIWDYHVILVNTQGKTVYDFDTHLNYPESIDIYFQKTFGEQSLIPQEFCTHCRVIPAQEYFNYFYSDRQHMLDEEGHELHPFPKWPVIIGQPSLKLIDLLNFKKVQKFPLIPINDFLIQLKEEI